MRILEKPDDNESCCEAEWSSNFRFIAFLFGMLEISIMPPAGIDTHNETSYCTSQLVHG